MSLGVGLLVGLVAATIIFFYRRRRAPKNVRSEARGRDGEALLGYDQYEGASHKYVSFKIRG